MAIYIRFSNKCIIGNYCNSGGIRLSFKCYYRGKDSVYVIRKGGNSKCYLLKGCGTSANYTCTLSINKRRGSRGCYKYN
jgi:hypothetical protein